MSTYVVHAETKDEDGWTPLHFASRCGYLDIVKYLIEECHCNAEAKGKNRGLEKVRNTIQKVRKTIQFS